MIGAEVNFFLQLLKTSFTFASPFECGIFLLELDKCIAIFENLQRNVNSIVPLQINSVFWLRWLVVCG